MSGFILCPECSNNLGEVQLFIDLVTEGYIKHSIQNNPKIKNYDVSKLKMSPGLIPPIGFILDAVGLKLICCRSHAMSIKRSDIVFH